MTTHVAEALEIWKENGNQKFYSLEIGHILKFGHLHYDFCPRFYLGTHNTVKKHNFRGQSSNTAGKEFKFGQHRFILWHHVWSPDHY